MTASPYLIDQPDRAKGKKLEVVHPGRLSFDRKWLQEMLLHHPDLLPTGEIEPVFHPLISIGQSVPVFQGRIDVLYMSAGGYPVIVDTKLWRSSRTDQQVASELMDLAFGLSQWDFEQVEAQVEHFTGTCYGKKCGLSELLDRELGDPGMDYEEFRQRVERNLELGRFLVIMVSNRQNGSALNMVSELKRYPGLGLHFGLIEMECFSVKGGRDTSLLVIPRIAKRTEIMERSVVEVKVYQERGPEVRIRQDQNGAGRKNPITLTEAEFWDRLQARNPRGHDQVKELHDELQEEPLIEIGTGTNGLIFRKIVPEAAQKVSLFFVGTDASINVQPQVTVRQTEALGLDARTADAFKAEVRRVLGGFKASIDQVDREAFLKVMWTFIEGLDAQQRG